MIIPVGYAHVQHFFGGAGLPNGAAITYGVSGFGETDPEAVALQMHLDLSTNWSSQWSSQIRLEETRVKFGPNATGPFGSHVEQVAGTGNTAMAPNNTALLIEKRTQLGGRSGRGRLYMPGLVESVVGPAGDIDPASLAIYQTTAEAWLVDIETTQTGMFLFHAASSDPTRVTSLTVDPVAATQRRRMR